MFDLLRNKIGPRLSFLDRPVFQLAKRRWKTFVYVALLSTIASMAAMVIPLAAKMMIDQIGKEFSFTLFAQMSCLFIFAILLRTIISVVILWVSTTMRFGLIRELLEEIYYKILMLSPSKAYQFQSGSLSAHLLNDVEMLISGVEDIINISIRYPLEYIGLLGVLFYISPFLCITVLFAALFVGIFSIVKSRQLGVMQLKRNMAKANLFGTVNENICFLKAIRSFDNVRHRLSLFREQFQKLIGMEKDYIFTQAIFNVLSDALISVFILLGLLVVGLKMSTGSLTPGSVTAALVTLITISGSLSKYSRSLGNFKAAMHAGGYIEEVTSENHDSIELHDRLRFEERIRRITFKDLHFSHGNRKILQGVNFSLSPGLPNILMGENGAGKSTIIDLLFGFYPPSAGEIFFNDVQDSTVNPSDLLRRMALVPQVSAIFSDSIRYNLQFGNDSATEEEILEAAQKTGVLSFLEEHGCSLDYQVGDRGGALSPGEVQRISLARALLRKPDVLVMDEPTNNLDEQTINLIWKVIFEYAADNIVLVVSHALPPHLGEMRIHRLNKGHVALPTETTVN